MRKAMIIGALTLAGSLASPAFADEYSGIRLGISLGQETMKSDIATLGLGADEIDATRFNYTVFGGWALNKWLAFEGAYSDGGQFNQVLYVDPDNFPERFVRTHYDVKSFVGSVVGSWWITPKFGVYGRAGVYGWKGTQTIVYDDDTTIDPPGLTRFSYDDDGFEPLIGVGLQTELDTALVRVEYAMTEFGDHTQPGIATADTKVSSVALSIVWTLR